MQLETALAQSASGRRIGFLHILLYVLGLAGAVASLAYLHARVFNVVTYQLEMPPAGIAMRPAWRFWLLPAIALVLAGVAVVQAVRRKDVLAPRGRGAWAMLLPVVTAAAWHSGASRALREALSSAGPAGAPLATTVDFLLLVALVGGLACGVAALPRQAVAPAGWCFRPVAALLVIVVLVVSWWHAAEQGRFWRNFSLGYADFGLFTTELEHCLPGKDVGPARFADTRMGYHCIPLFYVLAPLYAVWRSPQFLMFVGPLALHAAALPLAWLAHRRTGSAAAALVAGLGWIALPSLSRLPYSNTYGFQSIYLAAAPLAFALSAGILSMWRWAALGLALAMLAEETVCGVALGAGLYLAGTGRRRAGGVVAAVAILYVLLAAGLVIPSFASAARYTRLDLFGEVSGPGVLARLLRPRAWMYVAALVTPLWPGLRRRLGLALVAAPTLLLVLLLQPDYLNIKYWHQTTILVVLYAAAIVGATLEAPQAGPARASNRLLGMLAGAFVLHATLGFSPLAQAGRLAVLPDSPPADDPRVQAVAWVRANAKPGEYEVIATERLAAHFTDYRTVHALGSGGLATAGDRPAVLIVDAADRWDRLVAGHELGEILKQARDAGFAVVGDWGEGRVSVWLRPAPPAPPPAPGPS
jgi:hypothetical protein